MTLSKARQETALGEGLALGAFLAGVEAVNGNKGTLELNFRSAWRKWPHSSQLPSIKAGPAQDDVLRVLYKSERRATHHIAEWRGSWPFVPVLLQDWAVDELAESIHEEIPAQAWRDLVSAWLQVR